MNLKARVEERETVERVHGIYKESCPVYRTLRPAIDITTELVFEELEKLEE